MKILITGASGFIGKNLIPILINKKHNITLIIRDKRKIKKEKWKKKVKILEGNIFKNINKFFVDKFDILIHLAWDHLDDYSNLNHLINLNKHKKFIQLALDNKIKRFIFAGTCQEYGEIEGELHERMPTKPSTSYAKSKNELRKFIYEKKKKYKLNIQWLRIFYIYGSNQGKNTLFGQLQNTIKNKKNIFNMSSGEQERDYLHIKDLCNILSLLIDNSKCSGIINACSGKKIKIINLVKKLIGKRKIKLNTNYYKIPNYEPLSFWGSAKKLNKLFNQKR